MNLDAEGSPVPNTNYTDECGTWGQNRGGPALRGGTSGNYPPAVKNSVELGGLGDVPAKFKEALDKGDSSAFYRFQKPLTEEEQPAANFLVSVLENALNATYEDVYFRAMWYPGEGGEDILGLLVEWYGEDDPEPDFDSTSPEAKAIIEAIAKAFEMDPEELGGGDHNFDDPEFEGGDVPITDPDGKGGSVIID